MAIVPQIVELLLCFLTVDPLTTLALDQIQAPGELPNPLEPHSSLECRC